MKIKNIFETLKSSYDQLNNSLSTQSEVIEKICDNLSNDGSEVLQNFNIKVNDISGYVYKIVSDGEHLTVFNSDENGNLISVALDALWSNADISSTITNVDGVVTSLQEVISSINDGYEINYLVNSINEQVLNFGSVSKSYIYELMDHCNIDNQSKVDFINLLEGMSDVISSRDWCYFIARLYTNLSQTTTNADGTQMELNYTRGSVAGFWLTLSSLDVIGTVTQFLSTMLLMIPNTITRVIGMLGLIIGNMVNKVLSYATAYEYKDSALYSCVSAPIAANTSGSNPFPEITLASNGAACSASSPFVTITVFKREESGNITYSYNCNFNVSLKLSAIKRLLNNANFTWNLQNFEINLGDSLLSVQENVNTIINGIQEDDLIDYASGEGLMDDETRARTVAANIALAFLCAFPRTNFKMYDRDGFVRDGCKIYGFGASSFPRFTSSSSVNDQVRSLHRFMWLVLGHASENLTGYNSWGVDSIGSISDLINYIQDHQNDNAFTLTTPTGEGSVYYYKSEVTLALNYNLCHGLYAKRYDDFASVNSCMLYGVPGKNSFAFDLPNYSRQTLFQALGLVGLAATATCAAIIGVKMAAKKWFFKERMRSAKALTEAKAAYDESGSDADLDKLYKLTKKYNLKANLLGLPSYDPVNEWFEYDESSGTNDISLMYIARLITG